MPRRANRVLMKSLLSRGSYILFRGPFAPSGAPHARSRSVNKPFMLSFDGAQDRLETQHEPLVLHCSVLLRQQRQHRFGRIHLVAYAGTRHGGGRQVNVHARTKPDESEALAARELLSRVGVAQYAPCNTP